MSHRASSSPTPPIEWQTDEATFLTDATSLDPQTRRPVLATVTIDDPWLAFRRARTGTWNVCFETRGPTHGWNTFGVDPTATLSVWPEDVSDDATSLDALEATIASEAIARSEGYPPIPGGWFGWISYDVARELERLPSSTAVDRRLPRLQFARFETLASWRTDTDGATTLWLSSCPQVGSDPQAAFDTARQAITELASALADGDPATPWGDPRAAVSLRPQTARATYEDRVRTVKEYIREGDTFQVNLSQRFDAPATMHPVDLYGALREANPAPYAGLIETPDIDLISTSPELLLERTGRQLRTEPIAGTRPRGETDSEDRALAEELESDPKERAEHAMLVDLERNDLGKVCEPGSVDVVEYRRVDRYASVWHLVSDVRGHQQSDAGLAEVVGGVFPGGTVTGAPKPRTMEIIDELEEVRRGPYTGSMAVIGFDGTIRANMVIRTVEQTAGTYRLRVGGGIVHDSDPAAEYDETLAKGAAIRDSIADATPGDAG